MKRLRVFSYNIHKGYGWDRRYTLRFIRDQIRKIHPDLVFLQEVRGHHGRRKVLPGWPSNSQFEYLSEELWPHHTYGKNAVYAYGHHGNAILSKFPITSWENIDVSENRFENRGLLHAQIQISKGQAPLHAVCIHLGLLEGDRRKQLDKIVKRLRAHVPAKAPTIVAGDFNDWRQRVGITLGSKLDMEEAFKKTDGAYAATFPSFFPFVPLDRIYFKNIELISAKRFSRAPWNRLSDHLPLEAEFHVKPSV